MNTLKTESIKLKIENMHGILADFTYDNMLSNEQLSMVKKYISKGKCGEKILRYRNPKSITELHSIIVECLSYGKSITKEKMICMYGEVLGNQKINDINGNKAVSKEKMVRLYGEKLGLEKWKSYCQKQSLTNTFEYKQQKYGMTREEFKSYNLSRAITLDNMIKKYGLVLGTEKYESYCQKQSYAGVTKEYFIEEYGQKIGMEKYIDMSIKKSQSCIHNTSKVSDSCIDIISKNIHSNNSKVEYPIYSDKHDRVFVYDYIDFENMICVEFNGDFWHMNPNIYNESDVNSVSGKTAKQIWQSDLDKRNALIKTFPNIKYIVIWESVYNKSNEQQIIDIVKEV